MKYKYSQWQFLTELFDTWFIFRPTADGRLQLSQKMVITSTWKFVYVFKFLTCFEPPPRNKKKKKKNLLLNVVTFVYFF